MRFKTDHECRHAVVFGTEPAAHLLIHVNDSSNVRRSNLLSALYRLRESCVLAAHRKKPGTVRLQIDDRWGKEVFAAEGDGPLFRIALMAGTYNITACSGQLRRCYTLTLEQGAQSDLHLGFVTERR